MLSRQRRLLFITLALLLPLALAAPPASTHGGKGHSPAPTVSQWGKKTTDGTSNGAEAYKQLLPELSAAHRKRLEEELGRLKQYADKLAPGIAEAQKKTGFDSEAAMKDFRAAVADPAGSEQRLAQFYGAYEPQMQKLAYTAGLNIPVETARLTTLVNLRDARPITGSLIGVGGMDEGKHEGPPAEPPAPEVTARTYVAPYTSQGHSDDRAAADAATGRMSLWNALVLAGSSQKLAFITQDLPVGRGVRRVRVYVTLDPTVYGANAFNLGGYSSAEAIVNLRLLEGARVLASDRLSLGRAFAAAIGDSRVGATRPVTLQCEFVRPAPDDEATYTLVAEVEGWTGTGGLGGAAVDIAAVLRQFQIYLHR
jgi:hypothetical protein